VLTAAVLELAAEAPDQSPHDRHACVQAQLLKGNHVDERLEKIGEAWWTHAAQGKDRSAKQAIVLRQILQGSGVNIQTEYSAQSLAHRRRRVAAAKVVANVRRIDRAAVLDLNEDEALRDLEYPQVAIALPDIYKI
jgi:hypothetical protein